jgi:hypothetical protein
VRLLQRGEPLGQELGELRAEGDSALQQRGELGRVRRPPIRTFRSPAVSRRATRGSRCQGPGHAAPQQQTRQDADDEDDPGAEHHLPSLLAAERGGRGQWPREQHPCGCHS